MTRFVVLLPTAAPLRGRCAACNAPLDEAGCRLGAHYRVRPAAQRRTGVAQVVETFCGGVPTGRIVECPACP